MQRVDFLGRTIDVAVSHVCQEDDTCTFSFEWEERLDLEKISTQSEKSGLKKIFMPDLDVLVIIRNQTTFHLHRDGRVIINKSEDLPGVLKILKELFI